MDRKLVKLLLQRPENANKYDFGHVLIFGGSTGMVGAPLLSAQAALRIGAGLATIASDKETSDKLDRRVGEVMTLGLPAYLQSEEVSDVLLKFIQARKVNAAVVGPGLQDESADPIRAIVGKLEIPLVLDAGGLTAFREHLDMLRQATSHNRRIIITPHMGEYAKLTGTKLSGSQLREHGLIFATHYQLTLVLKGHHTLVAHADGSGYQNDTGNPGLATAGTGDVLAGMIGGLLAQGVEPHLAAETGVYLHGLAGDLAAAAKTEAGVIASDLIDYLPEAIKRLQ